MLARCAVVLMTSHQTTDTVLLVRPRRFAANVQTAGTNSFQHPGAGIHIADPQQAALAEFEALRQALVQAGIKVHVYDDRIEPHTPDALFPNNWVSFHSDGTIVLYPILAPNRRLESQRHVGQLARELVPRVQYSVGHPPGVRVLS